MSDPGFQTRNALFRQYGKFSLAYSAAFQPELRYFGDADGVIAYKRVGNSALALANPLAPTKIWPSLIDRFVAEKKRVSFWQITRPMAVLLAARGFRVNPMGVESRINLPDYSLKGPKKRVFRTAANRMAAKGFVTTEMLADEFDREDLTRISEEWRGQRAVKSREMMFLIRPVNLAKEEGVRKFVTADRHGRPVAFASYDPVCEGGDTIGYLLATKRWLPETDPLVGYDLARVGIETFQAEALRWLMLGNSPLAQVKDRDFTYARSVKQSFHFARNNQLFNRYVYAVRGISRHKASYLGESAPAYAAFNGRPGLIDVFRMIRACRII